MKSMNPSTLYFLAQLYNFLDEVKAEVFNAKKKFPSPDGTMVALTEEVGELAKALLDESWERVQAEAIQVACMAARVAIEGDPTLAKLRSKRLANIAKKVKKDK